MKQLAAALVGGAALLLVEIRFEHREALGETWHAWIPIVYASLLLVIGAVALLRFESFGRRLLGVLFAAAILVGVAGVWFHSDGKPVKALGQVAQAWALPIGSDGGVKVGSEPPVLAPAAFVGIGLLGLLACARR